VLCSFDSRNYLKIRYDKIKIKFKITNNGDMGMVNNGKVLFIVHDVYQDDNTFPSGIGYLAAALLKNGVTVRVYSQDVFHYTNQELAKFLKKEQFDLIGIGFLAARFKETIIGLCEIVNRFKKDAWLVLGGHGPSAIPEYTLKKTKADVVVIGEGEDTIIELLKCKLENGELSKIKGIAYRDKDDVYLNERRKLIKDLDLLPFPAWDLFPMEIYTTCIKYYAMNENDKSISISTSRGCINKCNFCYRMDKGFRYRSVKNVVEEMLYLSEKYGVTYFMVNDELFTYPRSRIFEFRDELDKNDLKIKFDCGARVDIMDVEVTKALKDAGCQLLKFGMESSDQRVLDLMHKNTTVEENISAAELCNKYGIGVGLNFIWNNIGDTEDSLKGNVKLIKKYNTYHEVRTIRPVTPYPGSELYYYAIEKGFLTGPDDFYNKYKNSDLITVNYTNLPLERCYKLLYEANKELVLDYFQNTTKDMVKAKEIIEGFYRLYVTEDYTFRGARHYKAP